MDVVARRAFGAGSPALQEALRRFLGETTASLDLANLELVAAASPWLDEAHLVELIDGLPRTRAAVKVRPVHIQLTELDLAAVLTAIAAPYHPNAAALRAEVLGELIDRTTIAALQLADPARLDEQNRLLVREAFDAAAGSADVVQLRTMLDPHIVDSALWQRLHQRAMRLHHRPDPLPLELMAALLSLPAADPRALDVASRSVQPELRAIAAAHPRSWPSTTERCWNDPDRQVRMASLDRTDAPVQLLERLAPIAPAAAASHPNAPSALLDAALHHRNPTVVAAVIDLPTVPIDELRRLAAHPSRTVRAAVAGAARTPADIVSALATAADAPDPPDVAVLAAAASHPLLPDHQRQRLAKHRSYHVRAGVARNPRATPAELLQLSGDHHPAVRMALIDNPRVTARLLEGVFRQGDSAVRRRVLSHPDVLSGAMQLRTSVDGAPSQHNLADDFAQATAAADTSSVPAVPSLATLVLARAAQNLAMGQRPWEPSTSSLTLVLNELVSAALQGSAVRGASTTVPGASTTEEPTPFDEGLLRPRGTDPRSAPPFPRRSRRVTTDGATAAPAAPSDRTPRSPKGWDERLPLRSPRQPGQRRPPFGIG